MTRKGRLLLLLMATATLCTPGLFSDVRSKVPRCTAVWGGIGLLNSQATPDEPHLAALMMFTTEVASWRPASIALDIECGYTSGSYVEGHLQTAPILLGARWTMFPSSPARLYASAGAGLCFGTYSWTECKILLFFPVFETHEQTYSSFALSAGGGIILGSGRRLFSIDYRYLAALDDERLGGHLLCLCLGFAL